MKKLRLLLIAFFLLIPLNVNALNQDYEDVIHKIVGEKVEDNEINVYVFVKEGCPHCQKEKQFLIDKNIIICRQLLQNYDLVTEMKLSHKKNIKLKKELHDILNIVL